MKKSRFWLYSVVIIYPITLILHIGIVHVITSIWLIANFALSQIAMPIGAFNFFPGPYLSHYYYSFPVFSATMAGRNVIEVSLGPEVTRHSRK